MRRCSGQAQWWPTRTATPLSSRTWPTSWACTPSTTKATAPPALAQVVGAERPGPTGGARGRRAAAGSAPARGRARGPCRARRGSRTAAPRPTAWRPSAPRPRTAAAPGRTSSPPSVTISIIEPPVRNGRHRLEQLVAPPQHADAGGAEHLVAGEGRKSTPRSSTSTARCGTDWQASSTDSAPTACARSASCCDRVDRAEHVGHVGEREDLGALGDGRVEVGRGRAGLRRSPATSAASRRCAGSAPATARGWRGAPSR